MGGRIGLRERRDLGARAARQVGSGARGALARGHCFSAGAAALGDGLFPRGGSGGSLA